MLSNFNGVFFNIFVHGTTGAKMSMKNIKKVGLSHDFRFFIQGCN